MLRSLFLSLTIFAFLPSPAAAGLSSGHNKVPPPHRMVVVTRDKWKGFKRVHLTIAGHKAWYVEPVRSLEGNPWIWKASFADWHTEMDSLLLVKGFHMAYISVNDQYGSPYAMQVWDTFYHYLVDSLSFDQRPALEGISRGGLYVYAWAKRNPDKVSCIYGEAPVCDIKSWPAGKKGKGLGDSAAWQQFMQVYKTDEAGALAFDDNPIDHLEGLASFKIPILHVISNADQYAPPVENTYPLYERYTRMGGPMSVYPVTAGPQVLRGHHFPIQHADEWARWILVHSYPVKKALPYRPYFNTRNGLKQAYEAIAVRKKATVAFLGGSITHNPGWRPKTAAYLKERFPETEFHFIAAGIPSLGSLPHAFRLQKDVLDSGKVDLLFVEAAVNDKVNGTDSSTQLRALEGIIRHAKRNNPSMDIVLMSFADPSKNEDYNKGIVPAEVANHERIAQHYGLASVNLAKEVHDKIDHREFTWTDDFRDVHPSPFGQELYFGTIKELFRISFRDAQADLSSPRGSTLSSSSQTGSLLLPTPLDPWNFENGKQVSPATAVHDKSWTLDQDWTPSDSLATRPGYVHVPMLIASDPGASLSLPFTGTAIGMGIASGADAGLVVYSIDGGAEKKIDLFTQWSRSLHLPWYVLFGGDLKNEQHTLKLRIDADKNPASKGHACRIVHFLVNEK